MLWSSKLEKCRNRERKKQVNTIIFKSILTFNFLNNKIEFRTRQNVANAEIMSCANKEGAN